MMIIPTILSSLGISLLSDTNPQNEDTEYYTIFAWNDGMKMQRSIRLSPNRFLCSNQGFFIDEMAFRPGTYALDTSTISAPKADEALLIGQRLAWLVKVYLQCEFARYFPYYSLGVPVPWAHSAEDMRSFSEKGQPDYVHPYEMTIYETGQMEKSLFLMSYDDFIKVIECMRSE